MRAPDVLQIHHQHVEALSASRPSARASRCRASTPARAGSRPTRAATRSCCPADRTGTRAAGRTAPPASRPARRNTRSAAWSSRASTDAGLQTRPTRSPSSRRDASRRVSPGTTAMRRLYQQPLRRSDSDSSLAPATGVCCRPMTHAASAAAWPARTAATIPLLDEWVLVSPHRLDAAVAGPGRGAAAVDAARLRPGLLPLPGQRARQRRAQPRVRDDVRLRQRFPRAAARRAPRPSAGAEPTTCSSPSRSPGSAASLCFSPRHDLTLARMDTAGIRAVVDAWADEIDRAGARVDGIGYVQVFENKGAAMGCSNPHPHGQIWASATVPHMPARKLAMQRRYAERHGRDLLGDYLARELPTARGSCAATTRGSSSCRSGPCGRSRRWSFRCGRVDDLRALTGDERDALADIAPPAHRALRQPLPVLVPVLDGLARAAGRRPGASRAAGCTRSTSRRCCVRPTSGSSSSGTK